MRSPVYYEELKEMVKVPVSLPEVRGPLPNTNTSYPFNAANREALRSVQAKRFCHTGGI